jgi:hypothetical protein
MPAKNEELQRDNRKFGRAHKYDAQTYLPSSKFYHLYLIEFYNYKW